MYLSRGFKYTVFQSPSRFGSYLGGTRYSYRSLIAAYICEATTPQAYNMCSLSVFDDDLGEFALKLDWPGVYFHYPNCPVLTTGAILGE